jgi:isopenicillin-N epimerase
MDVSRRRLLTATAALPALPPLAALLGAGSAHAAEAAPAVPTLARFREAFAFGEDAVPMNAANLCPSPAPVTQALERFTRDVDRDCSFQNRGKFGDLLEATRARIARQLRVDPDEVALVRNTSEGNNTVNNGLDLRRGDEVVLWEQNHPTNLVAWKLRAARFGLRIRVVSVPERPASEAELIAPFERAISARSRVLAFSHVSNVSGLALPAKALTELGHRHGMHVHVDGAQTWGVHDVDLADIGCDSYAGSGHKWYLGPREVGLLVVRREAIPRIWPNVVAPGWGDDVEPDVAGARKFESLGQRDDAALVALGAAAELADRFGPAAVEARTRALAQRLKEGLVEAGATLVTPLEPRFSGGVCIARAERPNRRELFDRLYREHGIAGAPTGGLRLSPHVYNTQEHVDRAVAGVKALAHLLA